MSAGDLPGFRAESSLAMAKTLVTYMDDEDAIWSAIKCEFHSPPARRTIRKLRAEHLASLEREPEDHRPCDAYQPWKQRDILEATTTEFLWRLDRERSISAAWAKAQGALDSPSLRQPAIVDRAWERETETAWRENGEYR